MSAYGTISDANDGKPKAKYNLGPTSQVPEGELPDADKSVRILQGRKATWAASSSTPLNDSLRVPTARASLEPETLRPIWPPQSETKSPKLVQGYLWTRHPAREELIGRGLAPPPTADASQGPS
tara:strand:- start:1352 stop:1723 length:372 start_codon:yes stop_codon:yes gene_type:complete